MKTTKINKVTRWAKRVMPFYFLAFLPFITSCGEFIEFDGEEGEPITLKLARHEIDLMVGDRFTLPADLQPANLANKTLYWASDNSAVIDFQNDTLLAVGTGRTFVSAMSVVSNVRDTCWVNVYPYWQMSGNHYQYDMVVYARITAAGHEMDDSIRVAAFVGDELRGVAQLMQQGNRSYARLRLYSESGEAESYTLRCYDRRRARVTELKDVFTFNGETIGTLSNLYPLAFE